MLAFPRVFEPIQIEGIICEDSLSLISHISSCDYPNECCFSDLTLGTWYANQVAIEFSLQADVQLDEPEETNNLDIANSNNNFLSFSNLVGTGIDAETISDLGLKNSFSFVNSFTKFLIQGPKTFIIFLEQSNFVSDENITFINLFAQAITFFKSRLIIVSSGIYQHHNLSISWTCPISKPPVKLKYKNLQKTFIATGQDEDISLIIPGILVLNSSNPSIYKAIMPLDRPKFTSKLQFDKLSKLTNKEWVMAYAQFHGNTYFLDCNFLSDFAWKQFRKGSIDLCLRYLQKAYTSTSKILNKAILGAQLQGIRIANWRFQEAAQFENITSVIPEELKMFLALSKAWGATITNQIDIAKVCFEYLTHKISNKDVNSIEYCYYMNIRALYELKTGNPKNSMDFEKKIENIIEQHDSKDFRLLYVNSLNIARLHKRNKNYHEASKYYDIAFSTSIGLRPQGEIVYFYLQNASFAEEYYRSEPPSSLFLKAALCWLSMSEPELITKRVEPLLGPKDGRISNNLPLALTIFLIEKLKLYFNLDEGNSTFSDFEIMFLNNSIVREVDCVFSKDRLTIFTAQKKIVRNQIIDPHFIILKKAVFWILSQQFGQNFPCVSTIIVPLTSQCDFPNDICELVYMSAQTKTKIIYHNDHKIDFSQHQKYIVNQFCRIRLHPSIASVNYINDSFKVSFRRYLMATRLFLADEVEAFTKILQKDSCNSSEINKKVLIALQNKKIIELFIDQELCNQVGFKLVSKETSNALSI